MRFERGKDPKEALNVGLAASPTKIQGMYTSDPDFPVSALQKDPLTINPESANLTHEATWRTLGWISEYALGNEWEEVFFIGVFTDEEGEETLLKNGGHLKKFVLRPIKEFKGQYLLYDGKKYKIPNEIRKG